jgi:hypothetical protein
MSTLEDCPCHIINLHSELNRQRARNLAPHFQALASHRCQNKQETATAP